MAKMPIFTGRSGTTFSLRMNTSSSLLRSPQLLTRRASEAVMILNTYSVLDGFIDALRMLMGALVVCLAIAAWRRRGGARPLEKATLEDRYYLLFLQGI